MKISQKPGNSVWCKSLSVVVAAGLLEAVVIIYQAGRYCILTWLVISCILKNLLYVRSVA